MALGTTPKLNSLVLYKNRPAQVQQSGDKLEIELESGKTVKVRPKDVSLLHPGPMHSLRDLQAQSGEVETAWELLAGSATTLPELSELIFETYTPATAWATWELVTDGLYFAGEPETIVVHTKEQVAQIKEDRAAKAAREQAWIDFLTRARKNQIEMDDHVYLLEVEAVAFGRQEKSRVLRELGRPETPESAHSWLLEIGYWTESINPYPARHGLNKFSSTAPLPPLPDEARVDLTHLPAFAIDDEGNQDPDDALSLDGERLWVHIADVAALVKPDSPADLAAREKGANLYLPEETVSMLPPQATQLLGLGLQEVSPAFSFGLDLDPAGNITNLDMVLSWVKVKRLSYEQVEDQLNQAPFSQLHQIAQTLEARRRANGEISIDLPEVKVRVNAAKQVEIQPLPRLRSRDVVREAMLIAGEAVARFAVANNIPFPYTTQDAPEEEGFPNTLSGNFARRMTLKRSQLTSIPGPHAGLGLDIYTKTTSPLRRYSDLVAHQQLRAHLQGVAPLDEQQVLERVGAAEAVEGDVRRTERLARRHWTLVYLMQHPDWQGEGVLVDTRGPKGIVLIPDLDLETQLYLREDVPLDSVFSLSPKRIDLVNLEAHFQWALD